MKRLIIVGSPRTNGRSAHLAEMLFEANIDEHPEDELFLVPVSEVEVGPCVGCNACRKKSGVVLKDDDGHEVTVQRHRCVFDDDMQALYDLIDDADEVTVVSPVYFSGAPAPMKCVLDRLQPYFWARVEQRESGDPLPQKRPLTLHVLGEGGDPHGYGALVSEVRSSFATADFRLERVLDWVGKIDESGDITAEATEVVFAEGASASDDAESSDSAQAGANAEAVQISSSAATAKPRPKLNLHSGIDEMERHEEKAHQKQPKGSRSQTSPRQAAGAARSKAKGAAKAGAGSARSVKGKGAAKSGGSKGSGSQAGKKRGRRRGN